MASGRRRYTRLTSCFAERRPSRAAREAKPLDRGKEAIGDVNAYEVMLMLEPELAEERQNEIIARVRDLSDRGGGAWEGHEPWGRRRLAYEIAKQSEANYHVLRFTTEPAALEEITRVLRITDGVMRHMAVRQSAPRATREAVRAES